MITKPMLATGLTGLGGAAATVLATRAPAPERVPQKQPRLSLGDAKQLCEPLTRSGNKHTRPDNYKECLDKYAGSGKETFSSPHGIDRSEALQKLGIMSMVSGAGAGIGAFGAAVHAANNSGKYAPMARGLTGASAALLATGVGAFLLKEAVDH